eukprot:5088618-Alexandrium_andersonii.AAC.1
MARQRRPSTEIRSSPNTCTVRGTAAQSSVTDGRLLARGSRGLATSLSSFSVVTRKKSHDETMHPDQVPTAQLQ